MDQPDQVTLTLTAQDLNTLLSQLIEGPYKVVAPLIQKIGEQARAQQMIPPMPQPMPQPKSVYACFLRLIPWESALQRGSRTLYAKRTNTEKPAEMPMPL